ncbi:MAG TPA: hypothetical protein DCQ98_15695 [Planctomycetaceae bacterium]|nr:hypothetical protein [Planctomycetaceae bacterium]
MHHQQAIGPFERVVASAHVERAAMPSQMEQTTGGGRKAIGIAQRVRHRLSGDQREADDRRRPVRETFPFERTGAVGTEIAFEQERLLARRIGDAIGRTSFSEPRASRATGGRSRSESRREGRAERERDRMIERDRMRAAHQKLARFHSPLRSRGPAVAEMSPVRRGVVRCSAVQQPNRRAALR